MARAVEEVKGAIAEVVASREFANFEATGIAEIDFTEIPASELEGQ
jgi:hypothetical protein